ncbi:MAG: lipoate--protein ligase [Aquificaceae bacterium]|nr:lipoate--protein ligase [Aquificaceae bacterium]
MKRDWENFLIAEHSGEQFFRLYMWKEATLSIGYSQKAYPLDLPVVKRPTGGGALLHGQDLSFSYAGPKKNWGNSFTKIYKKFMGFLLEELRGLIPDLQMSRYRGGYEGYFCYFYPTLGEITFNGKKLLACAMRVGSNSFLIHGSLFLDMDYEHLERLTGCRERDLRGRIVTLQELGVKETELKRAMLNLEKRIASSKAHNGQA